VTGGLSLERGGQVSFHFVRVAFEGDRRERDHESRAGCLLKIPP
jgi:hypothetical protein